MFVVEEVCEDDAMVPAHAEAICDALALRDRLDAAIAVAIGEFDHQGGWVLDGARSLKSWLIAHGRRSARDAARLVRDARSLRQLPVTAASYSTGQLSSGQVDAIVSRLSPETVELFADHESELIPTLIELPVPHVETVISRWRHHADALIETEPTERVHALQVSALASGTRIINGELQPVAGATFEHALRLAAVDDPDGAPTRTCSQKQADALVTISEFFLAHHDHDTGIRHTPHLDIHIDLDTLERRPGRSELSDGTQLPRQQLERLLCDSHIGRIITRGGSAILDLGRRRRLVTANQRRALVRRDRGCRLHGCEIPAWRCDAHHIHTWTDGGATNMANLVLLCSYHHHLLHRSGWTAKLLPDTTFEVTLPNGTALTSRPPP